MLAHQVYQSRRDSGMLRIDVILGLYDQALERIRQAQDALARGDAAGTASAIAKLQLVISGLVCGLEGHADELSLNFLRLYDFVHRQAASKTPEGLTAAAQVLRTLREGFAGAREEAQRLERAGAIPPLDRPPSTRATA